MKILLFVLAALEPHVSTRIIEAPTTLYRALGFGVYLSKVGDLASTEYGIYRGGVELNPLMRRREVRVAATALYPFAFNWMSEVVRKDGHPKLALWMRVGFVVMHGYLIQHNLRVMF